VLRQLFRFLAVGVVNTLVGLTAIYALMLAGAGIGWANFFGYALGLMISFTLNRIWTFASNEDAVATLPRYVVVAGVCYLLNLGVVLSATRDFSLNPYAAQLFGVVAYTTTMFVACRIFVFAPDTIPAKRTS
jgi:putative flippase GtrA